MGEARRQAGAGLCPQARLRGGDRPDPRGDEDRPSVPQRGPEGRMTRVDLRTSEWHDLITPVLPHASTDKDDPLLQVVRVEIEAREIIAVATDRTTLAAER